MPEIDLAGAGLKKTCFDKWGNLKAVLDISGLRFSVNAHAMADLTKQGAAPAAAIDGSIRIARRQNTLLRWHAGTAAAREIAKAKDAAAAADLCLSELKRLAGKQDIAWKRGDMPLLALRIEALSRIAAWRGKRFPPISIAVWTQPKGPPSIGAFDHPLATVLKAIAAWSRPEGGRPKIDQDQVLSRTGLRLDFKVHGETSGHEALEALAIIEAFHGEAGTAAARSAACLASFVGS